MLFIGINYGAKFEVQALEKCFFFLLYITVLDSRAAELGVVFILDIDLVLVF